MPIIVMNIQTPPSATNEDKIDAALKAVSLSQSDIENAGIYKSSIDARKRTDIHFVSSVMLTLKSKALEEKLCRRYKNVKYVEELHLNPTISKEKRSGRVVISGFGPCGMFCALLLSEYGYKPIVLERGADVDERVKAVEGFWGGKELDERTNVQFGEGGAGTFSDGKLTTRINDPLIRYVLKRFCEFGAPKEILYEAKPHLGTDNLRGIVKGIRQRIIANGGEIRFKTKLTDFTLQNGQLRSVATEHDSIEASALVLAIGHSARDTFEMLLNKGMILAPKPFSVGARIEHTQKSVDESLYGSFSGSAGLPKGEYQLSLRKPDGRAVYTFCMCPGGSVVAAQSELNTVVTNGMSEHSRDMKNTGYQLLDGLQATGYCRIRYTAGDDFKRAERQREVLLAVADQAKKANLTTLTETANNVFDEVYTSLDLSEIVDMLGNVNKYYISDHSGFPQEGMRDTATIGSKGSCVIPLSLEDNVKWLHKFLYGVDDYEPSSTVKECSEKIYEDTNGYINK